MCGAFGRLNGSYGRPSPGSPGPAVLLQLRLPGRPIVPQQCYWIDVWCVRCPTWSRRPVGSRLVDLLSRSHWFYATRHRRSGGFNARSSRVWRIHLNDWLFCYLVFSREFEISALSAFVSRAKWFFLFHSITLCHQHLCDWLTEIMINDNTFSILIYTFVYISNT